MTARLAVLSWAVLAWAGCSDSTAAGDVLVVGLNSDESVARLKGAGRPVNTLEDRAAVLLALGSVG